MPCSCQLPLPNFPTNCEWGPILWKIIHGLADKYGKVMSPLYTIEEENAWIQFINTIGKILPCKECREHYTAYLKKNNPNKIKKLSSNEQKLWVQKYFWNLHNEINIRNNKDILEFDQLDNLYKNINFKYEVKHYEKLLKVVFQYNEITLISWFDWFKPFRTITSIYGLE
jgi:hypothetical protein